MITSYLECNLPIYLKNDIDAYMQVRKEKHTSVYDIYLDCVIGSINSAEVENEISHKQAEFLRDKYVFLKYGDDFF